MVMNSNLQGSKSLSACWLPLYLVIIHTNVMSYEPKMGYLPHRAKQSVPT